MRLNKYLALCGLGSRRAVEEIIKAGEVTVGGRVTTDLATQIEEGDAVTAQGRPVHPVTRASFDYILLNKPRGYDVTRGGRHHHRRAWDLLPKETHPSVQSVGRLDRDSSGLLLFTNDGELAFRLTHPRYGCRKVYDVEIEGKITVEELARLTGGVELEDGPAKAVNAERLPTEHPRDPTLLRLVMEEGRNRIVRRMCEAIGHAVISLNRIRLGPLELSNLPRGKTRPLSTAEIYNLRKTVGLAEPKKATDAEGAAPGKAASRRMGPGRTGSRTVEDQRHHARPTTKRGQGPRQPREKGPAQPRRPSREGRPSHEGHPPSREGRPSREERPSREGRTPAPRGGRPSRPTRKG